MALLCIGCSIALTYSAHLPYHTLIKSVLCSSVQPKVNVFRRVSESLPRFFKQRSASHSEARSDALRRITNHFMIQDSPPLHQTNLYCKGLIFILEDTAHENKRMLCDF